MITRQTMNAVAVDAALRNQRFDQILTQIENRAKADEFRLIIVIGNDLVDRLKSEPYGFVVEVDNENPSEPSVIYWN